MKKYLFNLPPRDLTRKPYAVGMSPEVDAWAISMTMMSKNMPRLLALKRWRTERREDEHV